MSKIWPAALRYSFFVGLLVLVVVTLLSGSTSRRASATTGPKFSLHIHGNPCDPYYGMNPCNIYPGTDFSVDVFLDKTNLPDWDGDTVGGYLAFQGRITSSTSQIPYQNAPGTQEINGFWPACLYPGEDTSSPSSYLGSCVSGAGTPGSSYMGKVMQVTFRCNADPAQFYTISLVQGGINDTALYAENLAEVTPESPAPTLTVRCHWLGLPPTATYTPTPTRTFTPTRTPTSTPTVAGVGGVTELASSGPLLARDDPSDSGRRYVWAAMLLAGGLLICAGAVVGVRLLKRG